MFAIEDFFEAFHRLLNRDILSFRSRENFRDVERFAQNSLDLARAINGQLVLRAQFVHSKNSDDVL